MNTRICLSVIAGLMFPSVVAAAKLERVAPSTSHHRRPVAVQTIDATTAVVANRRSGTLSVIDLERFSVAAEFEVKGQPSDLAVHEASVLVTDAETGRLIAIEIDRSSARVQWEITMPNHPVSVRVSSDGGWCSVCCLWARKVVFVRLPDVQRNESDAQIIATVDLPFAPQEQLILEDSSRLLVADAFGSRLAVIRTDSHKLDTVHSLPANNIRGLARGADGERVFISHQILNEVSPPRASEVVWGVMLRDALRTLQRKKVLEPNADVMDGSRFIMVGNGTRGAGDPDALIASDDGRIVMALAGTGEVAVVEPDGFNVHRVKVERRPVAIAPVGDGTFLIANELSDSISRLDLQGIPKNETTKSYTKAEGAGRDRYAPPGAYGRAEEGADDPFVAVRHLSLGTSPKPRAVERGEAHFFDARLSSGGWYSCHSCHTDGHSSGGRADTLGDGREGAPKRILSLLGVAETGPWAWLGNKEHLNDQVHQSLRLTMLGRQLADREVNDLIEFLKTLDPPPPFQPATSDADRAIVAQGRQLFESLDCNSCHSGPALTSEAVYDVGLMDELGAHEFNPPSLRGVGHRYGLFHDNRAANVEQVVCRHKHQLPRPLSVEEAQVLIRYLKSL